MFRVIVFFILAFIATMTPARAAPFTCAPSGKPNIVVTADIGEAQFDFSLSRAQLNQMFGDATKSKPAVYHLSVDSVMTGALAADHKAQLRQAIDPVNNQTCISIGRVDVTLRVRPVIYMASEYRRKECKYKAFFTHEMKHVDVDKTVIAEYMPRIKQGIEFAFASPGDAAIGPVTARQIGEARRTLEIRIQSSIDNMFTLMMVERLKRQKNVDSYGEYASLSHAC